MSVFSPLYPWSSQNLLNFRGTAIEHREIGILLPTFLFTQVLHTSAYV